MFIATRRSHDPSSGGAKCDSLDNIFAPTELAQSYRAHRAINISSLQRLRGGLSTFFSSYFVIMHNSNTLTEHYSAHSLLAFPIRFPQNQRARSFTSSRSCMCKL